MYQSLWRHSSNAVIHISPQTFLHKCPTTWHNPVQALHDGPITRVVPLDPFGEVPGCNTHWQE